MQDSRGGYTENRQNRHQPKSVTKDEGENYIMIKGSIKQKKNNYKTYAPNIRVPKYMMHTLTQLKEIDSFIIIIRETYIILHFQ